MGRRNPAWIRAKTSGAIGSAPGARVGGGPVVQPGRSSRAWMGVPFTGAIRLMGGQCALGSKDSAHPGCGNPT